MASLFRNIVRLKFTKLREARNASVFVCMGCCIPCKRKHLNFELPEILCVASVFSTESANYRKRESNYRKYHLKFPYVYSVFGSVSLAAVNLNDKEGGNSPSSLTSQSHSPFPSNHVKRSANGRFTKPGEKGTPKNLEHVRRGYQNYIAKRKLEFGNCIDENEPPSKRETRSTWVWALWDFIFTTQRCNYRNHQFFCAIKQAATEREEAIPRGTRFIDLRRMTL